MKTELQNAWLEYCMSEQKRVDQESFVAGWEACSRYAGRSIDELVFVGRQIAQGVSPQRMESELSRPNQTAA